MDPQLLQMRSDRSQVPSSSGPPGGNRSGEQTPAPPPPAPPRAEQAHGVDRADVLGTHSPPVFPPVKGSALLRPKPALTGDGDGAGGGRRAEGAERGCGLPLLRLPRGRGRGAGPPPPRPGQVPQPVCRARPGEHEGVQVRGLPWTPPPAAWVPAGAAGARTRLPGPASVGPGLGGGRTLWAWRRCSKGGSRPVPRPCVPVLGSPTLAARTGLPVRHCRPPSPQEDPLSARAVPSDHLRTEGLRAAEPPDRHVSAGRPRAGWTGRAQALVRVFVFLVKTLGRETTNFILTHLEGLNVSSLTILDARRWPVETSEFPCSRQTPSRLLLSRRGRGVGPRGGQGASAQRARLRGVS